VGQFIKQQTEVLLHSPVATRRLWWAYPLRNKAPIPPEFKYEPL